MNKFITVAVNLWKETFLNVGSQISEDRLSGLWSTKVSYLQWTEFIFTFYFKNGVILTYWIYFCSTSMSNKSSDTSCQQLFPTLVFCPLGGSKVMPLLCGIMSGDQSSGWLRRRDRHQINDFSYRNRKVLEWLWAHKWEALIWFLLSESHKTQRPRKNVQKVLQRHNNTASYANNVQVTTKTLYN